MSAIHSSMDSIGNAFLGQCATSTRALELEASTCMQYGDTRREIVLEAVEKNGLALEFAAEELRGDRAVVLKAVEHDGRALLYAAEELQRDRAIVLAAVEQDWRALEFAAEELLGDRTIVLAAVEQDWHALQAAAEELQEDRAIVLAVVERDWLALQYVADVLLLDSTFASDAKKQGFILKITMLSGRYTCQFVPFVDAQFSFTANIALLNACAALGIKRNGVEVLVKGAEVIPLDAAVQDWPGLSPLGDISEFQLVVRQDA
eukprot:2195207-Amphidinium_carterae.1